MEQQGKQQKPRIQKKQRTLEEMRVAMKDGTVPSDILEEVERRGDFGTGGTLGFGDGLLLRLRGKEKSWLVKGQVRGKQTVKKIGSFPELSLKEAKTERNKQKADWSTENESTPHKILERAYWNDFAIYTLRDRSNAGRNTPVLDGTKKKLYRWLLYIVRLSNKETRHKTAEAIKEESFNRPRGKHGIILNEKNEERIEIITNTAIETNATIPENKQEWIDILKLIGSNLGFEVMRKCESMIRQFTDSELGEKYHQKQVKIRLGDLGVIKKQTTRTNEKGSFKAILDIEPLRELAKKAKEDYETNLNGMSGLIYAATNLPLRQGEWKELKWKNINLEAKTLEVAQSKTGISVTHPLSEQLANFFKTLKGSNKQDDHVFTGRFGKSFSVGSPSEAMKRLGYGEIQKFHGLRASFETIINTHYQTVFAGTRPECISLTLHHSTKNPLKQSYQRSDLIDERRILLQKWSNFLE